MSTEKIAQNVRARFNHHKSRFYLAEKYKNQLIFVAQGGTWTATIELLSFLRTSTGSIVILDDNERPTKVDAVYLYTVALDTYNAVMTEWHKEFAELEKNR